MRTIFPFLFLVLFCAPVYGETGTASWYSTEACKFNPDKACPTASGKSLYELEKEKIDFAAKWDVPFGTRYKVRNIENGKIVEIVILDRGPSRRLNRCVDLSRQAFKKIADPKKGIIEVEITKL